MYGAGRRACVSSRTLRSAGIAVFRSSIIIYIATFLCLCLCFAVAAVLFFRTRFARGSLRVMQTRRRHVSIRLRFSVIFRYGFHRKWLTNVDSVGCPSQRERGEERRGEERERERAERSCATHTTGGEGDRRLSSQNINTVNARRLNSSAVRWRWFTLRTSVLSCDSLGKYRR